MNGKPTASCKRGSVFTIEGNEVSLLGEMVRFLSSISGTCPGLSIF